MSDDPEAIAKAQKVAEATKDLNAAILELPRGYFARLELHRTAAIFRDRIDLVSVVVVQEVARAE